MVIPATAVTVGTTVGVGVGSAPPQAHNQQTNPRTTTLLDIPPPNMDKPKSFIEPQITQINTDDSKSALICVICG
jgi:hypothetical protein